jgi:hypothetical protein
MPETFRRSQLSAQPSRPILPSRAGETREWAMWAARHGWFVFPTRGIPDPARKITGKEPRDGLNWPAVATCDPEAVWRAHWRPGEGYGIAAKPSGLVILDLDRRKPGQPLPPEWRGEAGIRDGMDVLAVLAERAGQPLPSTFTVRTPRDGQHLSFLAIPGRPIGNRPAAPLIDVRAAGGADGGYVVGPGSVINGLAYEVIDGQDPQPLPRWLADVLDPPVAARPIRPAVPIRGTAAGRMTAILDQLAEAGPGQLRNRHLHWAACRFGELIREGDTDEATAEAALYRAAEQNGHVMKHGDRATLRTIASGIRTGMRQAAAA